MKATTVVWGLACSLVVAGSVRGESWSKRLTPEKPGDGICAFTVKVERLKEAELGDFLQFQVTVKTQKLKELPSRVGDLQVYSGKEFIAGCPLQPNGGDAERLFSFRIAARYAEKSIFRYAQSAEFGHIAHWIYLQDFVDAGR